MEAAIAQLTKMTKGAKKSKCRRSSAPAPTARAASIVKTSAMALSAPKRKSPIPPRREEVAGAVEVAARRAVDYIREWRALRLVRRMVDDEVFRKQEVDLIVTPTLREVAWSIEDELTRAANTRARNPKPGNTRSLDDYGIPTITVPCGFSKNGLPIGLQISGANWREADVLALAHAYQVSTEWHTHRPSLTPDAKVPVLSKTAAGQTGEAVTR